MPENSLTGWKRRIAAYAAEQNLPLGQSKIQRLALRIQKRAELLQAEFDFEAELRILGIWADPTARDAVRAVESAA